MIGSSSGNFNFESLSVMAHSRSIMNSRRCPCGSRKRLNRCCGAYHSGKAAPTPLALMKSRYSAYALGEVDYVMSTTHPDSPHRQVDVPLWREELIAFSHGTRFEGLSILGHGTLESGGAWVHFRAHLSRKGEDVGFEERSRFFKVNGEWRYLDGEFTP